MTSTKFEFVFASRLFLSNPAYFISFIKKVETFCPPQKSHGIINSNDCSFPEMSAKFPKCAEKIKWMMLSWKTHSCYAQDFNVNGTICSFLIYLSEVIALSVLSTYTVALENLGVIDAITVVIHVLLLGDPLFRKSWLTKSYAWLQ